MSGRFERYEGLVDDVQAFHDACASPLPDTCWMPPEYGDAADALPIHGLERLSWTGEGHRILSKDIRFGVHFLLGGLMIQEEAAMMAVRALGLHPGERVLDLCAAPGNKTVQLATAVGPQGCVVANDVSASRLQVLRGLVDRFRLPQVHLTVHDGASLPDYPFSDESGPVRFDAVLADVPCSCEGTSRKNPSVFTSGSAKRKAALPDLQESLLRRAIQFTRPGGRVLYATCTFAPEENEMVVDRVLSQPGREGAVRVEPFDIPGAVLDSGIDHWEGNALHPSLTGTRRLWPHRNDTGGFYLALLRKEGSSDPAPWPTSADARKPDPHSLPWSAYGLDPVFFETYRTLATRGKNGRLVTAARPDLPFNVVSRGMSGVNPKSREPRPSSSLAPLLVRHAHAGTAELGADQIPAFLKRQTVKPLQLVPPADRTRFVLVQCGPLPLGLGHVDRQGHVESHFPAHMAGLPVAEWLTKLDANR